MLSRQLLHRRYRPIMALLDGLPAEQASVRLTVADLDALLSSWLATAPIGLPSWTVNSVVNCFRYHARFAATLNRIDHSVLFTRRPEAQPVTRIAAEV